MDIIDSSPEPDPHFGGKVHELSSVKSSVKFFQRVDCRNFYLAIFVFLYNNIARNQDAHVRFEADGFIGKLRVARAKDLIVPETDVQVFLECFLDIDGCNDTETLKLQVLRYFGKHVLERHF